MKTLSVYRPNTIQNALSDFDRYFESFFGDSFLAPAARMIHHLPAVDIQETENAYVLDMDLPGYDEKKIEVNVDGASLTIASKQDESFAYANGNEKKVDEQEGTYILRERRSHSFSRSFKLPENADPESVSASFKNGTLNLQIKKRAEAQKKSIKINVS